MAKPLFDEHDKVWSPIYGNGKVVRISNEDDTMLVRFWNMEEYWYRFDGSFLANGYGSLGRVCSLYPAGSRIVISNVTAKQDCEEKKPATFKEGDEVIWLKPVRMRLVNSSNDDCVRGRVIDEGRSSDMDESWLFYKDSGVWQSGTLEKDGCIVHPGFKVESGKEPECFKFKEHDLVLVRDENSKPWKIGVFKREWKRVTFPYYIYNNEAPDGETPYRYCIPFQGNECKLDRVTD